MFADKLKNLRKSFNMTQKELADKLSVSPSAIGLYEQGRRSPDIDFVVKIASYFNVSTDSLLGTDTKPAIIPDALKEIGVEYIALAKSFKSNEIPPEDVEKILKVLKEMKE